MKNTTPLNACGSVEHATVSTYNLKASNGRHIRKATKVTFADGSVVGFMERLTKKQAIVQAREERARIVWSHTGMYVARVGTGSGRVVKNR